MDTNVSRRMAYNHYFGKKAPAKKRAERLKSFTASSISHPGAVRARVADF